jgi:hypothetical protein
MIVVDIPESFLASLAEPAAAPSGRPGFERSVDNNAGMTCWYCSDCGAPAQTCHAHLCPSHHGGGTGDAYYCNDCRIHFVCDDCLVPHDDEERS